MTFEEWWKTRVVVGNDNDKDTCRQVWEAATAAERERCAAIADKHARRDYQWASENGDKYHAQADWAERIANCIRAANLI